MSLPSPPMQYSQADQAQLRALIDQALDQRLRRGGDIEIAGGARLIFTAPNGTRYSIAVSNTPAITFTAA